MNKYVQK